MKKLLVVLGMIACMTGLVACGEEETKNEGPITEEQAVEMGTIAVEQMNMIVSSGSIEQYEDQPALYNGFLGWQSALEDIGAFEGTNGGTARFEEDEMIIEVNVLGSSHDATVELIFATESMTYAGITTNVHYTIGEIMFKALMNTVIGMGTVFVVLILISLIISCFTLVSKLEGKKKKKAESPAPAAAAPVVEQIAAKEELSDDTELVAVIAAAIAAYEGAASTDGFVVRSIRKSNKTKWQNA